jgi:hypothetical protein
MAISVAATVVAHATTARPPFGRTSLHRCRSIRRLLTLASARRNLRSSPGGDQRHYLRDNVTTRGPASAASLSGPCDQAPTKHSFGTRPGTQRLFVIITTGPQTRCNLSDLVRENISGDAARNDNIASLRRIGPSRLRSQKRPAITPVILALASRSSRLSLRSTREAG